MSLDEFVTKGSSFNYADSHHKHAELRRRELTMESEILDNDRERNEIEKGEKKAFDQIEKTPDNKRSMSMSSGIQLLPNSPLEFAKTPTTFISMPASNLWLKICLVTSSIITIALIVGLGVYYGISLSFKAYKQSCSIAQPCTPNTNLICNNTCICDSASYWDGFKCTPLLIFGSTCYGGSFQCITGLSCVSNICQCESTSYYDGIKCNAKLPYSTQCQICSYSPICKNCISCQQCQDYANLACNATTLTCMCPFNTSYYDATTQICTSKLAINVYCYRDLECQDLSKGLYCQISTNMGTTCLNVGTQPSVNFCNCPITTYYNGAICKPLETYYASCVKSCNCDQSKSIFIFICLMKNNKFYFSFIL